MEFLQWFLIALGVIVFLIVLTSFICFLKVFYFKKRKPLGENEYEVPEGEVYAPFREQIINWTKKSREMPYKIFEIKSFDGLKLKGKYYECNPNGLTEILFHGYKSTSERDLCGAIERCFAIGRNALLVDHRASGGSEGRICTFGIKERKDCKAWVDFAVKHFGKDVKLGISGVSMGAATVLMATEEDLPENVKFVLADCGFSSAKEIIKKVIREMKLPADLLYPFVKLGAKIFGNFDLEETTPVKAAKNCKLPVIFVHGDNDDFVPYEMSKKMFEECGSEKKCLITVSGAGHGLAYPKNPEKYLSELRKISKKWQLL